MSLSPPNSFASTHWSLILAATKRGSPDSQAALAALCEAYWYPLYAFARRRTANIYEAQDLTQAFFAELLEKNYLADARPERGRFRAFLLTAFTHFLSREWERARAQKRGGGCSLLSLDFSLGEDRLAAEPASGLTPEQLFDRQWAVTLLDRVRGQLAEESRSAGKGDQFSRLAQFIGGDADTMYADAAAQLGTTEGAVKTAVHRLRRRYKQLVREEIGQIVADPSEIDDEIRSLFAAFG